MTRLSELIRNSPPNDEIRDTIVKCYDHIGSHKKIMCSVSGGYDSDILLDLIALCGGKDKTAFVFNDTGLEYDATHRHLEYLETQYGIQIIRLQPKKAIPTCVRSYGVPFWSKYVSEMLHRLQKHNFKWENEPYETLVTRYPNCCSALRWWCNAYETRTGKISNFNIEYVRGLKEFIRHNPPDFPISAKCCDYAKKKPTHDFLTAGNFDLNCMGVRKKEGGARATIYKSCFDQSFVGPDNYRPLFWWTDKDKEEYRNHYDILRSDCYEVWGMQRTGCAGCPFGKDFENELKLVQQFEPNRYKAMLAIFGASYEYTRKFLAHRNGV